MSAELKGRSLLGRELASESSEQLQAVNPQTGDALEPKYSCASLQDVDRACELAEAAFATFRRTPVQSRAKFLRAIASQLENNADAIVARYINECALPEGRARGELGRTAGQLRLFADLIEDPTWNRPAIDHADPDRTPVPKPDTRLRYVGVGPVAVFGPANFPLAFTVAGGDSASAWAAGCPVIVKAHSSHPGTSELVGQAVRQAAQECELPEGVFSLLFGSGREIGPRLVQNPAIKAVGFTGSKAAGRSLFDLAAARPEPIPVFAEMSSVNPVVMLPQALEGNAAALAEGLFGSVTLGVGQFCTNPGLVFLPKGTSAQSFADDLQTRMQAFEPATMLNRTTQQGYYDGCTLLGDRDKVETLLAPAKNESPGCQAAAALYRVGAADFLADPQLGEEVFGPATLLVKYEDIQEVQAAIDSLGGQLTVTIHATSEDAVANEDFIAHLETRTGRIVMNGFPTGVEVCKSMVHGGPYPATTDSRYTSVGTEAIYRFTRPVCYQNFVSEVLPIELRD